MPVWFLRVISAYAFKKICGAHNWINNTHCRWATCRIDLAILSHPSNHIGRQCRHEANRPTYPTDANASFIKRIHESILHLWHGHRAVHSANSGHSSGTGGEAQRMSVGME